MRTSLWGIGSLMAGLALAGPGWGDESLVSSTYHTDSRGTPSFYLPPPGTSGAPMERKTAEDYLRKNHDLFKLPADLSNLTLISALRSLLGMHYRYQQVMNGLKVEGGEIVVSLREDGSVFQIANNIYPATRAPALPAVTLSSDQALDIAWDHLRVHGKLITLPRAELMYVPQKESFRLIYRSLISTEAPFGHWEHRIDALSGEILSVRSAALSRKPVAVPDFSAYRGAIAPRALLTEQWRTAAAAKAAAAPGLLATANGTGRVFDPDPRATLMSDALLDTSPSSTFASAYFTRSLLGITSNAGVFSLSGPWVNITELEAPTTAPSTTTNGQWTATRGNNAFNDAMCYFHIDQNQRYLQSLGFTNIQHAPISVDSDGVNGDDNSYYMGGANTLAFGHGGVDDDEDADVILHEYGHAITYSIVPTWGAGGDTGAIGEGFGDYWGASYSYVQPNGSTYHPAWAFTWDGHGADTWSGRLLDMTNLTYDHTHTYVDHEPIGGIANYSDQLWGTPIFQAFVTLSQMGYARTNMDRIMIQSFYGIGGSPKMRDFAYAIVNTASNLYPSAPYASVFYQKFVNQLIIQPPAMPTPVALYPAGGEIFLTGDTVRITWNRNGAPALAAERLAFAASTSVTTAFLDNAESGTNGWTRSHASGTLDWNIVATAAHSPTRSWYATNQAVVSDLYLVSPAIVIPPAGALAFWHRYSLESSYDGGVVEISTNAGVLWADVGTNSTQNGYSGSLASGSALAGRSTFTGTITNFVETRISLAAYAGRTAAFRFRAASDSSVAYTGWWVDDVAILQDVTWSNVATTATNASQYTWRLPLTPTTTGVIRIQQFGSGYSDSGWLQGQSFTLSVDSDGDRLPDAWELRHLGSLASSGAGTDSDGDGFSDLDEYRAGTLPRTNASLLRATAQTNHPDGSVSLQWSSASNRIYTVARATNLLSAFVSLATNLPATPPLNTFLDTDTTPRACRFYQIHTE